MTINIPSGIFQTYFDVVDYLIDEPHIGKNITLGSEARKNKTKSYNTSFEDLDIETEVFRESIRARLYYAPRDWVKSSGVEWVDGRIQIIGRWEDVAKIERCSYLYIDSSNTKMKLMAKPLRHGFANELKYFVAFLDVLG